MPVIQMNDVSFSYAAGSERALDHVTLAIEPGSFVGVIGPSGSGKSTLAHVLSGAIPHHYTGALYGSTLVDGRDTCEVTLTDIARMVGSVAQDIDAQMVAAQVEDELLFGLENFGVSHTEIEARLSEALATVGIGELRDREIATLSGGQKQKVAIAAILALKPRVLVLDEPTAALDPVSSRAVFETLAAVRAAGVTVVVIEQKVALLSEYCDRIVVLDGGRVALEGTPHEVFSHAEELRAIGVDSPRVARVSNSLGAARPCLSVDEAVELVQGMVGSNRVLPEASLDEAGAPGPNRVSPETSLDEAGALVSRVEATPPSGAPASSRDRSATSPFPPDDRSTMSLPLPGNDSAHATPPILTLRDVSFSYPGASASVTGLNLEVRPGEFVAVIGQNGAGKTTLTKLVNGLLKPASGTVAVAGLSTAEVPTSAIARHVATLFQNPDRQLCKNTVLDEVAFSLELQGVRADEARERARAVIDRFGLPASEPPFSLSRGERQMVALASVVVTSPALVLLDEPTSGLNYRECMTVMATVREMASRGCAVVMVCHDMEVVSDFAERLVVMADGRILGDGPAAAVFADEALLRQGSVRPPQVVELSSRLAREVSPAFAGITEVSVLVSKVKELAHA